MTEALFNIAYKQKKNKQKISKKFSSTPLTNPVASPIIIRLVLGKEKFTKTRKRIMNKEQEDRGQKR